MSLEDYKVENDKFEPGELTGWLGFPCNACNHQEKEDSDYPCNECGHNLNALSAIKEISR